MLNFLRMFLKKLKTNFHSLQNNYEISKHTYVRDNLDCIIINKFIGFGGGVEIINCVMTQDT